MRLGSGSHNGQYGTELWVNLRIPYAWTGRTAHYLTSKDFQVVYRDPRMLSVQLEAPLLKLKILVGHAPHCGHSHADQEAWWNSFSHQARLSHDSDRLLVLMDANADPGPCDECMIFQHGFPSNENTPLLHDFMTQHALCLPATGDCHCGPHTTWTSPNGAHQHCLDHVAVQQCHRHECIHSSVLQDLDLGNGCWDHNATAVQLQWQECGIIQQQNSQQPKPLPYDVHSLCHDHVQMALADSPSAPWEQDIESHVAEFNQHLLHGVAELCPRTSRTPKKPIFTEELWQLREQKLITKKALKEISKRQKHELLQICFLALCPRAAVPSHSHLFWHYDTWLLCSRVRMY